MDDEVNTMKIKITDTETALAFLSAQPGRLPADFTIDADRIVWKNTCIRCGGKGHLGGGLGPYAWQTCFACGGHPVITKKETAVTYARRVKAKEAARVRATAKLQTAKAAHQNELGGKVADFDRDFPGIREAMAPYLPVYNEDTEINEAPKRHSILNDMAAKLARYGSLSPKAVDFAKKLLADEAAPKVELAEGKRDLEGTVMAARYYSSDYGDTLKFTLNLEDGTRVFGTVPSALQYCDLGRVLRKGDRVALTATVTRSDDSADFGFFKRPSKARLVEAAPEGAPSAIED